MKCNSTIEQLELNHSDNKCNIILDPNYLTYNEIIEDVSVISNPSNNINFCFLSK